MNYVLSEGDATFAVASHLTDLCSSVGKVAFNKQKKKNICEKGELEMPVETKLEKKKIPVEVPIFTVQADHCRNCDLLLQSIPNCRLRSTIKASRTTITNIQSVDNSPVIPKDQAHHLGSLPTIPGMQLTVDSANLTYEVTDPLFENKDACKRIQSALKADDRPFMNNGVRGVPPLKGTLDVHRMKTLCREVVFLLEAKDVKMRKGLPPSMDDVVDLPGKFLLNPGSRVPNSQPRFEEDLPDYVDNLQRTGG